MSSQNENSGDNINTIVLDKEAETDDLIAELCLSASTDNVKFCLRNYQFGKNLAQLEKDFEKEKRDTLRETADYLQIPKYMDKTKKSLHI